MGSCSRRQHKPSPLASQSLRPRSRLPFFPPLPFRTVSHSWRKPGDCSPTCEEWGGGHASSLSLFTCASWPPNVRVGCVSVLAHYWCRAETLPKKVCVSLTCHNTLLVYGNIVVIVLFFQLQVAAGRNLLPLSCSHPARIASDIQLNTLSSQLFTWRRPHSLSCPGFLFCSTIS